MAVRQPTWLDSNRRQPLLLSENDALTLYATVLVENPAATRLATAAAAVVAKQQSRRTAPARTASELQLTEVKVQQTASRRAAFPTVTLRNRGYRQQRHGKILAEAERPKEGFSSRASAKSQA